MSMSPDQHARDAALGADSGVSSSNVDIMKSVTDRKTSQTANPPKRRGPKPDSKPALTRRQELNRQAQRTHRERKEQYIKALEDEVLRLKEIFSNTSQEKQRLADENAHLKELLAQSGVHHSGGSVDDYTADQSGAQMSTTSVSGSSFLLGSQDGSSPMPTTTTQATAMSLSPTATPASQQLVQGNQMRSLQQQQNQSAEKGNIDLEQAGIEFVLTLERPCMMHLPFVLDKASQGHIGMCGHALMASCPPAPFQALTPETPFENTSANDTGGAYAPQGTWELGKADLSTLLDLSLKLDLDGEITPIMAWGMVLSHPRSGELIAADFTKLAEDLLRKVRCYGFGAVMEEFELRDAMENVLCDRNDVMMVC